MNPVVEPAMSKSGRCFKKVEEIVRLLRKCLKNGYYTPCHKYATKETPERLCELEFIDGI